MYDSLRLSAGGGINCLFGKAEQAPNTATIAIGIGGTGISALRLLKKTVFERVKQDNYDKRDVEKPQYKRIKFLAIDSDKTEISSPLPELDLSDEFFYIGVRDIIAELKDKSAIKSKKYLDWFNKDIHIFDDANKSFSGIRQVGKYLLAKKASELYNKFKDMIMTAVTGLGAGFELNIYIMSGLAGGTGSGCFVDVCYIMQQALSDLGYAGSANVVGFFFLPDVNLSNPNIPRGGPHEIMLKTNGYAALKELDYLMGIPNNGDVYRQKYSEDFKEIVQSCRPVKLCNLISAKDANGDFIVDGYNQAMNIVTDFIMNLVVKFETYDEWCANYFLRTFLCNYYCRAACILKDYGANYVYNILGTSCATVPYKKIGTYLAIRFFDSIKYISNVRPNKEEVEKVSRTVGLQLQSLDMAIKAGTPSFSLDAGRFDTKVLKAAEVGTIAASLSEFCNDWLNRYADKRTSNIKTLGRELYGYSVNDRPESIIGKIFKELIGLSNNPDLGPYYAAYMIQNAQNHTLASVLAGVRAAVVQKRDHAEGQEAYRYECMTKAQAEFRSASIDLFDRRKKAYVSMVEHYFRNKNEIATYNDFITLLDKIKKNLDELEANFFKKYTGIIDKLLTTFQDNAEYFNTHGMGNEMYTWSIVEIESIKDQLDEVILASVKKTDNGDFVAPYLVEKFNAMMLNNTDKWFDESKTKIAELISDFIKTEFHKAMSKSMKQYLQEKYDKHGADLIDCIATNVIKEDLVDKVSPMFCFDTEFNINNTNNHIEFFLLSVPDNEADFAAAAQKFKTIYGKPNMSIARTVFTDRIHMLKFFSGIPMYAWNDLIEYEKIYYNNMSPGLHLFEGKDKDWRKLPSPIPATYSSLDYIRPYQAEIDRIFKLYDDARAVGIIIEDRCNRIAKVRTSEKFDVKSIMKDGWDESRTTVNDTISALEESENSFTSKLKWFSTLYANQDFETTIKDNFARKPVFVKAVAEELEKYNSIIEALNEATQAKYKFES